MYIPRVAHYARAFVREQDTEEFLFIIISIIVVPYNERRMCEKERFPTVFVVSLYAITTITSPASSKPAADYVPRVETRKTSTDD